MTSPETKTCPNCGHINSTKNTICTRCESSLEKSATMLKKEASAEKKERKQKDRYNRYQAQEQQREQYQDKQKTNRRELAQEGEVTIKGVDIPFMDLVILLVKLSIASIPAAIIVAVIGFVVMGALGRFASLLS
jgi:hypothetical protein